MPELSISTWSLHHELGPSYGEPEQPGGERPASYPYGEGKLTLLELPARVAAMGIHNLEICHFHFPRTDQAYLDELKGRLRDAGVKLFSVLIDRGDITAPDPARREADLNWIRSWIDIAAKAGAANVRIIAGDATPSPEAVAESVEALRDLTAFAQERGVGVMTENFHRLTMQPEALLAILDGLNGQVGLCADLGNYGGPNKYEDLKAILPRARTIHTKTDWPSPGKMDADNLRRYLDLSRETGFQGSYVLIFDSPGDEWSSLAQMKEVIGAYL